MTPAEEEATGAAATPEEVAATGAAVEVEEAIGVAGEAIGAVVEEATSEEVEGIGRLSALPAPSPGEGRTIPKRRRGMQRKPDARARDNG
jgi:hypothetical protein